MAFGLNKMTYKMAALAAILLCWVQTASAEVCDKAFGFAYDDIAPVNASTELLMFASGPVGGLTVFFVGLYLATSKPGVLLGLSIFLTLIGLADVLSSRDEQVIASMIDEGCAAINSVVGPVFFSTAVVIAIVAIVMFRRETSSTG